MKRKLLRAVDYVALTIAFLGLLIFAAGTLLYELARALGRFMDDLIHLPDDPTIRWLLPVIAVCVVWVATRWKELNKR